MPWWWNALQGTARNITLFLDKSGDDRRTCPQCRGSGIFHSKQERKSIYTNLPCWFCEGVGVLPVLGLSGFVLARATSHLQALDIQIRTQPLDLPVLKAEHNKCSFSTFSLGAKQPSIINDSKDVTLSLLQKGIPALPGADNLTLSLNIKSRNMRIRRILPESYQEKKRTYSNPSYSYIYPNLAPLVQAVQFSAVQKKTLSTTAAYTFPEHQMLTGYMQNSWIPMQEASLKLLQVDTVGKWRFGRRPRNRIREKAAKQALERARIVMRKLKHDDKYQGKRKCKKDQVTNVNKQQIY